MNEYINEDHVAVASASIVLTFDETVDFSTYNASWITLQSKSNATDVSNAYSTKLSGRFESVGEDDGTTISFTLLRDDANELKRLEALAASEASTFMTLSPAFVADMYGNPIVAVTLGDAKQVSSGGFTADTTPPQLLRFTLDMDAGTITFIFDETVKGLSIQPDELTIRDTSDPALQTTNYTLTGAIGQDGQVWEKTLDVGTFPHDDTTEVVLTFTKTDLDEIKRLNLCTRVAGGNDCFIVHTEYFVKDMEANDIVRCT
jgi:hypothetical protein